MVRVAPGLVACRSSRSSACGYSCRGKCRGAGGKALGFRKRGRAKLLTEAHGRVTFEDVAGVDEAKQDLQEIVEFLRDPGKFQRLGGAHSARRAAGRAARHRQDAGLRARDRGRSECFRSSPFRAPTSSRCSLASAPRRVRDMFEQAKKKRALHHLHRRDRCRRPSPRRRPRRRQMTRREADAQTSFWSRWTGFEANEGIILIAATNRPRCARPRAAAARPLRPPGDRAQSRRGRSRADPQSPRAQGAACAGLSISRPSPAVRPDFPAPIS